MRTSKISLFFALGLLVLAPTNFNPLFSHTATNSISGHSDPLTVNTYRVPNGTVYSYQPTIVLAQVKGQKLQISLSVTVRLKCSSNETELISCPWALQTFGPYTYPFLPYPSSPDWYFAAIPGLPNQTIIFPKLCPGAYLPKPCHVGITLSSVVYYSLYINGLSAGSYSYSVQQGNLLQNLPPVVGAIVSESLVNPALMQETYGLSPDGWVAGQNEAVNVVLFSFSPYGIKSLKGYYSVSSGLPNLLSGTNDVIQTTVDKATQAVNNLITALNSILGTTFRTVKNPISVQDATIPAVGLGNYVTFNAVSTDNNNNSNTSPEGFYYTVNKQAQTRVLVVDPHVELWLALQNVKMYANLIAADLGYRMPTPLVENNTMLLRVSQLANQFEEGQFHYWNLLGEDYNITISFPDAHVATLLQNSSNGGFQPGVIYLSDLSLGYTTKTNSAAQFFDWDLNDTTDSNGNTILSDLISYVQQHHTALIGSAGTLSDWEVWQCSQPPIKIEARGDVGDSLSAANPINETTLAPMFGMPLLPVFEYLRDQAAQSLCSNPQTSAAGAALGSMPLLVPGVPWNGTLKSASSFSNFLSLIPNSFIMSGLPSKINIVMPSYQQIGYNATNTVGWQLSLPIVLASSAWKAANQARTQAQLLEKRLASLSQNITNEKVSPDSWSYLDYALNNGIHDTYGSITHAALNSTGIYVTLRGPSGVSWSKFVKIPVDKLSELIPVRVAALSPDNVAGIITYDKYYSSSGYRSVYFSFPIEASNQSYSKTIIINAINWAQQWTYKNLISYLGNLIVSRATAQTFQSVNTSAKVASTSILVNEQGNATVSFSALPNESYSVITVHPDSANITLTPSANAKLASKANVGNNVTVFDLKVGNQGPVDLYVTSDPLSSLNPVYIQIGKSPSITTSTATYTTTSSTSTTSQIYSTVTSYSTSISASVSSTATSSSTTASSSSTETATITSASPAQWFPNIVLILAPLILIIAVALALVRIRRSRIATWN